MRIHFVSYKTQIETQRTHGRFENYAALATCCNNQHKLWTSICKFEKRLK